MINLEKGQKINLSKDIIVSGAGKNVTRFTLGLGWVESDTGTSLDIDSFVIPIRTDGVIRITDVVYYAQLEHSSGAITHMGDDTVGNKPGEKSDCEQIQFDLSKMPYDIDRFLVAVNIYRAREKGQHFGMVRDAYVNLKDTKGNTLVSYNLGNNYNKCLTVEVALFEKINGEWIYTALGEGTFEGSIGETVRKYDYFNFKKLKTGGDTNPGHASSGTATASNTETKGFFKSIKEGLGRLFK